MRIALVGLTSRQSQNPTTAARLFPKTTAPTPYGEQTSSKGRSAPDSAQSTNTGVERETRERVASRRIRSGEI